MEQAYSALLATVPVMIAEVHATRKREDILRLALLKAYGRLVEGRSSVDHTPPCMHPCDSCLISSVRIDLKLALEAYAKEQR